MTAANKVKVSITLSGDLLRAIDREAARADGHTRSSVIEAWLRRGQRRMAETRLAAETVAYYQTLTEEEREEDRAWSSYSSRAFETLDDE
jgi:metal-responsive CopG/Arc/MetJ family transcriptional regulator